ncbi:MAG: hypothetical protein ATN32_04550, partial [Candidatus Epulonipiscium fishelsonii]
LLKLQKVNIDIKNIIYIKGKLKIQNDGKIILGKVIINSGINYNLIGGQEYTSFKVFKKGKLIIKDNVGISNTSICSAEKIIIEKNVNIGGNCKIWDTDFHSINIADRLTNDVPKAAPIHIKSGVWIGGNSIILKGVTIGKNSVVATGSIVTKNIPANQLWGGVPAKYIKSLNN